MVTFGTILLGLVVGVHPVSVLVGDGVAAVEIYLDRELVAVLRSEPWTLECDFGWRLAPHDLVAVAFDGEGREVDRARQLVNLPRPPAEAALVLDDEDGRRIARLTWEAVEGATEPLAVRVSFDGEPLVVEDPERIELPPHDDERLHFLRAELDFTENTSAVVELTYGGYFAERVSSELTAVPVTLTERRELPPIEELAGWVEALDGRAKVVAVENGPAEVFIVRSASAIPALEEWRRRRRSSRIGTMLELRGEVRAGFVWPYAEPTKGRNRQFSLFPFSSVYPLEQITLIRLAQLERQPPYPVEEQRLADAVAVAGMGAVARDRRRAVILIVGTTFEDHSQLAPAEVRDYLAQLRVPLFVWSFAETEVEAELEEVWGSVFAVGSVPGMVAAMRELDRTLRTQRILWVEGVFLPTDLSLGSAASGISLAGQASMPAVDLGVVSAR